MNTYNETRKYESYFLLNEKARKDKIVFIGMIVFIFSAAITYLIK